MHFPDFTPYEYGGEEPISNVLNIGWLSIAHPYGHGVVSREFVEALKRLVANPVNLYRGSHICEFCPEPEVTLRQGMKWIDPPPGTTGNGEIRVVGSDCVTYVAPVLVLHYVETHGYLPPRRFIDAVLASNEAV